ncbi:MAG: nodulation protein NfeD [Candidatus Bathyarchaeia archaeon]
MLIVAGFTTSVESQRKKVLIVKLNREITASTASMIEDAMGIASNFKARLVVVEANTPGGEINAVKQIMEVFESSTIPVCLFVYPMGASAWSGGTYLLMASHIAAMASGTSIGSAQPITFTGQLINDTKYVNALSALMMNHAQLHDRNRTAARLFVTTNLNLGPEEAMRYKVVELVVDDVSTLLKKLSEKTLLKIETEMGASIWKLVPSEDAASYSASLLFRFSNLGEAELIEYQPGIRTEFLQIIFNPLASTLMFTLGFFLLLIGVQTPGLGTEFVGGLLLLLSLMSLQVIGIEPTMFLLFIIGFALIIAELKTNIGFLGAAGAICIILGSFLLFPSPQWLLAPEVSRRIRNIFVGSSTVLCIFFGVLVYKATQAKRLKVKAGSELVEGSVGVAATRLTPYGEVRVRGEFWRARAEEGLIPRGADVIVVKRDGLLLIVREETSTAPTQPDSPGKER